MNNKLEEIYYKAGIRYYNDDLKFLIKNVISDLYSSDFELLKLIKITHVDHAVFKYKCASKNKKIYNTRKYFKACLKSAIEELGIDN